MTRFFKAPRLAMAVLAASLAVPGMLAAAPGDTDLPASALSLRSAVMAMSLADAALPAAIAASSDGSAVTMPASSAAMKPETSSAMAAMKTASARNTGAGYVTTVSYERRTRSFHTPFPLILGVAY